MEIKNIQVVENLRKLEIKEGDFNSTTPRQAITTTNINHSNTTNYNTPFLEILIGSVNYLKNEESYKKEILKAKKYIQSNQDKFPIISIKGITSNKIKLEDFKLICNFQKDLGLEKIRLFFKDNLYKNIDELMLWVKNEFGNNYYFVLDHNLNFTDFRRLYLSAIESGHDFIFFLNRKVTSNNKEKFLFIQGREKDKIVRWVSLLSKKTEDDSVKPLFYYWLGYDVTAFTTRVGRYQIPEYELEVIKNFNYIPVSQCLTERCVIIPTNTLSQSINQFSKSKRDSVPCSAFSIVELNNNFEDFAKNMDKKKIISLIQNDIQRFNELSIESQ